jgi:HAMP domain-containing protein
MSSLDDHLIPITDPRLAIVNEAAANLIARLSELTELRERVSKAELSARPSRRIYLKKGMGKKKPPQLAVHSSTLM